MFPSDDCYENGNYNRYLAEGQLYYYCRITHSLLGYGKSTFSNDSIIFFLCLSLPPNFFHSDKSFGLFVLHPRSSFSLFFLHISYIVFIGTNGELNTFSNPY